MYVEPASQTKSLPGRQNPGDHWPARPHSRSGSTGLWQGHLSQESLVAVLAPSWSRELPRGSPCQTHRRTVRPASHSWHQAQEGLVRPSDLALRRPAHQAHLFLGGRRSRRPELRALGESRRALARDLSSTQLPRAGRPRGWVDRSPRLRRPGDPQRPWYGGWVLRRQSPPWTRRWVPDRALRRQDPADQVSVSVLHVRRKVLVVTSRQEHLPIAKSPGSDSPPAPGLFSFSYLTKSKINDNFCMGPRKGCVCPQGQTLYPGAATYYKK